MGKVDMARINAAGMAEDRTDFELGEHFRVEHGRLVATGDHSEGGEMVLWSPGDYLDIEDLVQQSDAAHGWDMITGFSGQHGYSGPLMHVSEQFDGPMADAVRREAGMGEVFKLIYVEHGDYDDEGDEMYDGEPQVAGWMLLRRNTLQ